MKILLFFPVKESYTQLWEYYKNDRDILEDISSKVYYSNNLFKFISSMLKVDCVYIWWWHTSIIQIIIAKILRKKIICTGAIHMFDYSGSNETFFKRNFIYRLIHKISLYLTDISLFLSNDQKNQITSHLDVAKFKIVYSSLEKDHLKNLLRIKKNIIDNNENKKNETTTLVSTLWLTKSSIKRKGLYECLDALEELHDQDFIFYIIGKKDDGYDDLVNKIENLNIKNKINILTDLPTVEKFRILELADLYLQPSHYEGLGNAVIEAMSRGCIPIVSRFASQPEVVEDYGYVVNEICKLKIKSKIIEYFKLSRKEKDIMKEKILDYSHKKFSYDSHLQKLKNILESFNLKNH